ncbi:MAG: hypothetical protein U0790_17795 [Isosphaeraceae bacterium]
MAGLIIVGALIYLVIWFVRGGWFPVLCSTLGIILHYLSAFRAFLGWYCVILALGVASGEFGVPGLGALILATAAYIVIPHVVTRVVDYLNRVVPVPDRYLDS